MQFYFAPLCAKLSTQHRYFHAESAKLSARNNEISIKTPLFLADTGKF